MDYWTYPTSDVDEVPAEQSSLLEDEWRVAEARRVCAQHEAEVARLAEVEQAEAQAVRDRQCAAAPPLFGGAPAFGFTL